MVGRKEELAVHDDRWVLYARASLTASRLREFESASYFNEPNSPSEYIAIRTARQRMHSTLAT
jgi:hypothetical protein